MELLHHLAFGMGVAFTADNVLYALLGCVVGTLSGVLPGIGPVATMAMLLPAAYALPPLAALILLAGLFFGAQYGRSTAAILVNVPGAHSALAIGSDGLQMARQGRAGAALAGAGLASFFSGCVGALALAVGVPLFTELAVAFGPTEYVALLVLGLVGAVVLASGPLLKALAMVVLGMLLGLVGADANSGVVRFAFDAPELGNGIGFVAMAMGLFGYGEIISNLAHRSHAREPIGARVHHVWPSRRDGADMAPAVLRGTALGALLGLLPGGSTLLAAYTAYALEKSIQPTSAEVPLGKGNVRGVASIAAARYAAAQTSFAPLLALGLPSNAVMALMLGAMTLHHIEPGPQIMFNHPEMFWGLVASMGLVNLLLVVLNLPLMGIWIKLLSVPYRGVFPAVVLFCAMGAYSIHNSTFDIWLVGACGFVGYVFHQLDLEPAPLLLGFILGPMLEQRLRGALQLSGGDWSVFISRPLSAGLLLAAVAMVVLVLVPVVKVRRAQAFDED